MSIDTLRAYEDLVATGINEKQARAQVYLLESTLDHSLTNVATKDDLQKLDTDLQTRLTLMEKSLKVFFGYTVGGAFLALFVAPLLVAITLKIIGII